MKRSHTNAVLAVAGAGIFTGGGILIGINGLRWLQMDPLAWQAGFWGEFVTFAAAIVPAYLMAIFGIFQSRRTTTHNPEARRWWTIALVLWGLNTAITTFYHLPENLALQGLSYSAQEADSVRTMWLALHIPRLILALGMFVATILGAIRGAETRLADYSGPRSSRAGMREVEPSRDRGG